MKMSSGWNLVFALVFALLCGQSNGFIWPFSSVYVATDAQDHIYPDANAKRIAIIGMLSRNRHPRYLNPSFFSVTVVDGP